MQESKIDEELVFKIAAGKITIHQDLPRQRKDLGEIKKLMESIKEIGQIQPIMINRNNELIAGGRRLAACTLLGISVRACYKDTIDPILMREIELEENLQRKDLTPAEECFAVEELVRLKQEKYGIPTQGRIGGYTLENAAEAIGKTKGNVIESLQIASMLQEFPKLKEAKTKSEIKKAYKGLQRIGENLTALSSYEKKAKKEERFSLVNENAIEHMKTMKDKSVNLLFTDPPYAIDIHKIAMTTGGKTGGNLTTSGITYNDAAKYAIPLIEKLAVESYRFTTDKAFAYIFCGRDRFIFQLVYDAMVAANWNVLKWPIIWIKMTSGQNNQPTMWPSSCYEAILFARKTESKLILEGQPDWIQCDIITPGKRVHQAEKPVTLCKELISRVALPGYIHYDPFMGSGAIIEAACKMKLISIGCEKSIESFATAVARLNKWKEKNKDEK